MKSESRLALIKRLSELRQAARIRRKIAVAREMVYQRLLKTAEETEELEERYPSEVEREV